MHAHSLREEKVTKLVPGGERRLAHLSDSELLSSTRRLVGASNRLFAELLLHLAEVETRGIHRTRACSSLYTYCVHELRLSEDAAARRSSAARWVKQFPALFDAISRGELHLTGLLMLGPHLTPENHRDVLARAQFRTKKELAKLVRELHPLPRVPDVLEPLGPELPRATSNPTWEQWVTSLCPPVRELMLGERPQDWANDAGVNDAGVNDAGAELGEARQDEDRGNGGTLIPLGTAPARRELPPITSPQQYQMQFCATEEHVQLVERAKALLARMSPGASLGELHLQAMKLLVAELEKKRFAVATRPHKARQSVPSVPSVQSVQQDEAAPQPERGGLARSERLRGIGRHVPAAVKREVFLRDGGSCGYVDQRGVRCRETRYLELHHFRPFARGGQQVAANLSLRCAAHNALAAEEDFGRERIERQRDSTTHESFAAQLRPKGVWALEPD